MDSETQQEEALAFDFSSTHTDNFPKILKALNISLAVTSYQSARLFFLRSDGNSLETYFKPFARPMGLYADRSRLTLGTFSRVVEFTRSDALLKRIQNGEMDTTDTFSRKVLEQEDEVVREFQKARAQELNDIKAADALYLPRASLVTGMINIHDIAWGTEGLWVVNSTFSCLSTLSPTHSFVARWKPPFITELVPEDRCHLNGMAMKEGRPKYVTTFNREDRRDSWNDAQLHDGTLIDVDTNEILLEGMIMPHSPRYFNGAVYLCESGRGEVQKFNPATGRRERLLTLPGYPRGMTFYGPLMFVGLSKVRFGSLKNPIPISKELEESKSGVWIFDLEKEKEVGHLSFPGNVDQIYDIAVIPESIHPELAGTDGALIRHLFDFTKEDWK